MVTEFFVWAPNAESVTLLHWHQGGEAAEEHPMTGGDDGVWRCETPALPGDHYLFRVRRGEESWDRIDPRAREVTNSVGRGVVPAPAPDHEPFTARPLNEWVIYELHAGTFGGDLAGSVDHLDELAALGVTTIELMPVAEFAGDQSWGYNPAMPFAVESSYGGPQALHHFVDACHERGLAVVLDVVYNHLGPSDLDAWRFDGWGEGDGGGIYFYNDWRAATPWGATRPDYGRAEVRGFLLDNARMWLGEYALDGLRLDSTVNIRNAHGHGGPDGDLPDGRTFLQELTDTLHHEFPGCVLIAEDMQGDPLVTAPTDEDGLGFDAQWDAQFVHVVRAALTQTHDEMRDVDGVVATIARPGASQRVIYTESHDEVANGSTRVPAEIDPGAPRADHAIQRTAVGALLVLASPGVPLIFQGQEWADEDWFEDSRPLSWDRRAERSGLVALWTDLIRLRTGSDAVAGGLRGDQCEASSPTPGVIVLLRWGVGGRDEASLVVINLFATDHPHVQLGVDDDAWTCVFSTDFSGYHPAGRDTRVDVHDGGCALPPYAGHIFVPST